MIPALEDPRFWAHSAQLFLPTLPHLLPAGSFQQLHLSSMGFRGLKHFTYGKSFQDAGGKSNQEAGEEAPKMLEKHPGMIFLAHNKQQQTACMHYGKQLPILMPAFNSFVQDEVALAKWLRLSSLCG